MDKNLIAIKNFMFSFDGGEKRIEGRIVQTKATVDDVISDCIFDDSVECSVTHSYANDSYGFTIIWNGLNDASMRKLGLKGIYWSNKHDFTFENGYLQIEDCDNLCCVKIKAK